MDFFLMLQEWCFKSNYTEESSSLRGPALISFLLWQNPEVNILDEEGPILAHSKRSFNPWSLGHVALGPVLRQSIMVRVQKSKAPPLREPESKEVQEGKGCISKGTSLPVTRRHILKVPPGVMTKSLPGRPQARGYAKVTETGNITAQQLGKLYKINLLVTILLDHILKLPLTEF